MFKKISIFIAFITFFTNVFASKSVNCLLQYEGDDKLLNFQGVVIYESENKYTVKGSVGSKKNVITQFKKDSCAQSEKQNLLAKTPELKESPLTEEDKFKDPKEVKIGPPISKLQESNLAINQEETSSSPIQELNEIENIQTPQKGDEIEKEIKESAREEIDIHDLSKEPFSLTFILSIVFVCIFVLLAFIKRII